jgi:methionyl-tRNA synthetase
MVLSDIIKRWQVLKERNALLLTGTDEHGMKVVAPYEDLNGTC